MADLPEAGASFSSRIQVGVWHRDDATGKGRRGGDRQKAWSRRADTAHRGHRDSRTARIPERNARRYAVCVASADQVAWLRTGRHHFDGTRNWADNKRIQLEVAVAISCDNCSAAIRRLGDA